MVTWVVMGVSGCGKSSVGLAAATALRLPYLEGDDYHPDVNIRKMREGVPLTDADRSGWLQTLGGLLAQHPNGAVLSCSALTRDYRNVLRTYCPGLQFAFLELPIAVARLRVVQRDNHFLPATMVESQFDTLEPPVGETDVRWLTATAPLDDLVQSLVHCETLTSSSCRESPAAGGCLPK